MDKNKKRISSLYHFRSFSYLLSADLIPFFHTLCLFWRCTKVWWTIFFLLSLFWVKERWVLEKVMKKKVENGGKKGKEESPQSEKYWWREKFLWREIYWFFNANFKSQRGKCTKLTSQNCRSHTFFKVSQVGSNNPWLCSIWVELMVGL